MFKIKITKNGPYHLTGKARLVEETSENRHGVLQSVETKNFPDAAEQFLCRCGQSANKPFCDGSHAKTGFDGTETADQTPYLERAERLKGPTMDLLDDQRCAYARFCHRERAEVWTLTENSADPENLREAVEGACACPSGRLTAVVNHQIIEENYAPTVAVSQDPEQNVSAGLFVRGQFELEGADGSVYEKRNRVALCRCGASENKPFCDASHVSIGFQDHE